MQNEMIERHRLPFEYLAAAKYLAQRGLTGDDGDSLPANMTPATVQLINSDLPRFRMFVSIYSQAR